MTDAAEQVAVPYGLTRRDRNRTGRQVGESGKDVAIPHDHVIAEERRQSSRAECHGVLERNEQLAQRMDPASLGDAIGGAHDLTVERCVDLGSPGVALAGPYADEEATEDSRGVVAETGPSRVNLEQIVSEPLAVPWLGMRSPGVLTAIDRSPRSGKSTMTALSSSFVMVDGKSR